MVKYMICNKNIVINIVSTTFYSPFLTNTTTIMSATFSWATLCSVVALQFSLPFLLTLLHLSQFFMIYCKIKNFQCSINIRFGNL